MIVKPTDAVDISFRLNGTDVTARVSARLSLVDLLRIHFRLTGSHIGCEHGVCGACNVIHDGVVVRGCLTLAIQADGGEVITIEGLTESGQIRELQDAFVRRNALQCGFCTSGMLMTAWELLSREAKPSRARIREDIGGNYCRCTGYQAIVDAIESITAGHNHQGILETDNSVPPIGASWARPNAARLATGRGSYTDDLTLPDVGQVAFLRSPHAHAHILSIELSAALSAPGVIAVFSGATLAASCPPWQTRLASMPAHRSAPQPPLAVSETCWQGEAIAAVVATTRAQAEDAVELIEVEWEALAAVADLSVALNSDSPVIHSKMLNNLALDHSITLGDITKCFSEAAIAVEHTFRFDRQTAVSLEPRSIQAAFDCNLNELTVYQSHQAPFQMREIFAEQLGMDPERVKVIVKDVGGSFGMKLHAFADEMAVVAIAKQLPIPVKFTADRLEAFTSDAHTRDIHVRGRMGFDQQGKILGIEIDMLAGFGAYSIYPRSSVGEAIQAVQMVGAAYEFDVFSGRVRGAFQNKPPTGPYRGVGQPIACTVTEQLLDLGAAALQMDPVEIRRVNYRRQGGDISKTATGVVVEQLSLDTCLGAILQLMNYDELRKQQKAFRDRGVFRGIGVATFIEITGVGPALYGSQGLRVAANEACRLTLTRSGKVNCETSITDQGQGTATGIAQIVAAELGIAPECVAVVTGNTAIVPYGGGAWASRGIALGGEAARRAALALRENVLNIAASLLQQSTSSLAIRAGSIINATGSEQISIDEIAAAVYYRPHTIPLDTIPPLETLSSYIPQSVPYIVANGVQAALVEIDSKTGLIKVLDFWIAEDCGRLVNPLLVDEQLRGGVVQGIGSALYEQCIYSKEGQLLNGSLADYMVPMASEMPDIHISHIITPTQATTLGSKGVGEAGAVGAPAAVWTAVNDALRPLRIQLEQQPLSPEHVVRFLSVRS